MTPEQLKASILQYAIQGKLVEQRVEEGNAENLYRQIQEEKQRLFKEGKIKKEKTLSSIEEKEYPFDIPEGWMWVRLGSLITVQNGYSYKPEETNKNGLGFPVIKSGNVMSLKVELKARNDFVENPTDKMLSSKIVKGDMLMCLSSQSDNPEPLGKTAIYEWDTPALLNQRVLKMRACDDEMTQYLYYVINSEYFHYTVSHQGGGSAQANLKMEHVLGMIIPLPPLEEQHRIVAKIEELLPYVDCYAEAYEKLEQFNAKFPEDMKKSILQYAIQGKLVEQRPEEGTAEELYNQICIDRENKIKAKLIKRDKRASLDDMEEEKPFDIPENWKWVTLGSILLKLTDGTHKTPKYSEQGIKFVSVKDMSSGVLSLDNTKFITEEEHKELYNRCDPQKGDMLLSKVGTTGVPAIIDTDEQFSLFVSVALLKYNHEYINEKYLYYLLLSPLVQKQASENTRGVGNKNWVLDAIGKTLITLPPYKEQERIVEELEKLLPYCDQLIK